MRSNERNFVSGIRIQCLTEELFNLSIKIINVFIYLKSVLNRINYNENLPLYDPIKVFFIKNIGNFRNHELSTESKDTHVSNNIL